MLTKALDEPGCSRKRPVPATGDSVSLSHDRLPIIFCAGEGPAGDAVGQDRVLLRAGGIPPNRATGGGLPCRWVGTSSHPVTAQPTMHDGGLSVEFR